jgi:hypothetical protein
MPSCIFFLISDSCHGNGKPTSTGLSTGAQSSSTASWLQLRLGELTQVSEKEMTSQRPQGRGLYLSLLLRQVSSSTRKISVIQCGWSHASHLYFHGNQKTVSKATDRHENWIKWPSALSFSPASAPPPPKPPVVLLITQTRWLGPGTQSSNMSSQPICIKLSDPVKARMVLS